jgi:HEXXH motif-containing protein
MSHTEDLITFLEGVVHECSHQYFYMARMLTALRRDPDDNALYYSSIVSRHRTIDRILLAYHATANILLCLHEVRSASRDWSDAATRRIRRQQPICKQLLDTLIAHADRLSHNANEIWQGSRQYVEPILRLN